MDNLFNDDITKSIASTVQDVLEGKPAVKKEEIKYPHMMYDPKTGEGVEVKDKAEHDKYSEMGWGHDKPKSVSEVEEPNVPSKDANMGSKEGEAEKSQMHEISRKLLIQLESKIRKYSAGRRRLARRGRCLGGLGSLGALC